MPAKVVIRTTICTTFIISVPILDVHKIRIIELSTQVPELICSFLYKIFIPSLVFIAKMYFVSKVR